MLYLFINYYFPKRLYYIRTKTSPIDDRSQRLIGAVNGFLVAGILASFTSLVVSANAIRYAPKLLDGFYIQETCYNYFKNISLEEHVWWLNSKVIKQQKAFPKIYYYVMERERERECVCVSERERERENHFS
jgi:hypothetical protein